jgi:hypothetical protein
VKRLILCGLLGGLLATNTGCGLFQAICCYHPCGSSGDCGASFGYDGCDEGCGPRCGPACRPMGAPVCGSRCGGGCGGDCDIGCGSPCGPRGRQACGRSCGPCADPCADPCGDGCYGRCWHRGPLSCIFALFMRGSWCGSGCGERYWGDFHGDPPDCWDPCDCHGNYTGGYPTDGYPTGGGCRSCGNGHNAYDAGPGGFDRYSRGPVGGRVDDGMPAARENIVSETDRVVDPGARAAGQPHKAVRP